MIPPSGRQVELIEGDQRAVITEVGGGLRRYDVGTWAVVDGYERDQIATGGRGQLLMPWPNRIGGGCYQFGGVEHQLPLDEPERGNAIHGLVRWEAWAISQPTLSSAVASHCLLPRPGYPFHLELRVRYDLGPAGLAVALDATNLGNEPAPFGAGWHPYLSVGTGVVDDAVLQIPADRWIPTDDGGLPRGGSEPVAGTGLDFRSPRQIGDAVLDTCYTDLHRDEDRTVHARLSRAGGAHGAPAVEVWGDSAVKYLMAFTGDTLSSRRRQGLALEPMTCPPDAFRTGQDLVVLDPGETFTARWGIRPVP
jgi:aldose 1-epimerase